ncbi:MAG: YegS/Rv2252/BmrU family lipid kinase [Lachnospiraceae bacterium]|nr:YegS/Rv2252/BmrU family lipid kinase [Lachnospiraceae bacterium]
MESERKRLFFIYNQTSGKARIRNHLADIIDVFIKAGYRVEVHATQGRLDAKEQVMRRWNEFDRIVVSGGDGTLNEAVSGMVEAGGNTAIGYIPCGSTNDYSVSLGLPKQFTKAASVCVEGIPHDMDVGCMNGKHFVYVAAFGAFSKVSYTTPQNMKNILGHQAYIIEGAKSLTEIKPHEAKVTWDNGETEGSFLLGMISNSTSVGGFKGITGDNVDLSDGLFEVTLLREIKNPNDFGKAAAYILGLEKSKNESILNFKTKSIHISSKDEIEWSLDGEYGGSVCETQIDNIRHAFRIITK